MSLLDPQPAIGMSNWKHEVMQLARRVDQNLNLLFSNDYDTNADAAGHTNLSGTVTYDTGVTGGVARLKTGIVANSYAIAYNAGGATLIGSPLNESWYAHSRCSIRDIPTVSNYLCVTIQDTFGTPNEYVSFGYWTTYSTIYLTLIVSDAGGTVATVTNVAADLINFHDYAIGRDVVNDKLYAMLDGVPILELDGPFATLTSNPCFSYSGVARDVLGDDIELWVDNTASVVKQAS